MRTFLLCLFSILVLQSCSSVNTEPPLDPKIEEVEQSLSTPVVIKGDSTWTIEERMRHYEVPGVSIAVIHDGRIAWRKGYGTSDSISKTPVSPQTLFQAGSISKPVAAYGALQLVEQNKLELEGDVNDHLTSWRLPENEFTGQQKVSLKHLLNHSAGTTVHGFLGYGPGQEIPTTLQVLQGTAPANSDPVVVDKLPGEGFRYSGGGYTLMQLMMQEVGKQPFPQLMQELVLSPLGMQNSSYFQPLQEAALEKAATGYLPDGSATPGNAHIYPEMAAAGLWTTAEDLAIFLVNIQKSLKGESELGLSKEMTTTMLTPYVEDFTGLGLFLEKEGKYFGHSGWNEGFCSNMIAHKDKGYGVVVLTNANKPEFISEIFNAVALGYEWEDFVPVYENQEIESEILTEISGRYRLDPNRVLELYEEQGRLFSRENGGDPQEVYQISDSTYVRKNQHLLFQFEKDSTTENLQLQVRPSGGPVVAGYDQLGEDEKLPVEFLIAGDPEAALEAYRSLFEKDPKGPAIQEANLNVLGYRFLRSGQTELARDVFKVNLGLYPESANAFDSYAEALMILGEKEEAVENYKRSLALDPHNTNAENMIKKLQ